MNIRIAISFLILALSACSTYQPLKLDSTHPASNEAETSSMYAESKTLKGPSLKEDSSEKKEMSSHHDMKSMGNMEGMHHESQ